MASIPMRLYDSGLCPFAQRVRIACAEKGLPFEHVLIDMDAKPADFLQAYLSASPSLPADAKPSVPVLEHNGLVFLESLAIAEYVDDAFPGAGPRLAGPDADAVGRHRVRHFLTDTGCQPLLKDMYGLLRVADAPALAAASKVLKANAQSLDRFLQKHQRPGGPYLLGEHFSMAEVACAPFLQRMQLAWPACRKVDPLAVFEAAGCPTLRAWAAAVLARPSVQATFNFQEGAPDRVLAHMLKLASYAGELSLKDFQV